MVKTYGMDVVTIPLKQLKIGKLFVEIMQLTSLKCSNATYKPMLMIHFFIGTTK